MTDETALWSIHDPRIDYLRRHPDEWVAYLKSGFVHPESGDLVRDKRLADLAAKMQEVHQ